MREQKQQAGVPIGPNNPPHGFAFHKGLDEGGFARPTVVTRWPVIVTDVVNAVLAASSASANMNADSIYSGANSAGVIARLSKLKYEIARDKPFSRMADDVNVNVNAENTAGNTDADARNEIARFANFWDAAVATHFPSASFFSASWLFAECLLYARIHAAINASPQWFGFDPFLIGKRQAFIDVATNVASLAESHLHLVDAINLAPLSQSSFAINLRHYFLLALWGNATDLSMFAGLSDEEVTNMRNAAQGETSIISNHLSEILEYFDQPLFRSKARIDFVLDNSGFELYSDLLLADYLHSTGRVRKTVFHCKTIPWFVSDTMPADFNWLIDDALANPSIFFASSHLQKPPTLSETQVSALQTLAARFRQHISSGAWVITSDPIWCTFYAHHHLHTEVPHLFNEWKNESGCVIFKGDLNYRKLVYDARFPATWPFRDAIGSVAELPAVVSLRTNKSDPIVGLAQGVEDGLLDQGYTDWRWSGKFAVVEFSKN
ncbi:hypothetical protein HK100_002454 [Physocladia obscura]|uniref:Sugar phosphate phosphatase n=1 Tax=Physocladia obscura TaxID=109957 RepID=A0AAD5SX28_9FUNG|nr:hypothetical protein HK100_002454 [Physocladia obscura]